MLSNRESDTRWTSAVRRSSRRRARTASASALAEPADHTDPGAIRLEFVLASRRPIVGALAQLPPLLAQLVAPLAHLRLACLPFDLAALLLRAAHAFVLRRQRGAAAQA